MAPQILRRAADPAQLARLRTRVRARLAARRCWRTACCLGRVRHEDPPRTSVSELGAYWARSPATIAAALGVGLEGLTTDEAARRLARHGPNELKPGRGAARARVLWRQVRSPLVLLLAFAAGASSLTGEWADAGIVAAILVATIGVGYHREYRAETAVAALLDRVRLTAAVVRDGATRTIPARDVVPGDLVVLAAGSIVPADAVLIESNELHVDDAALTGESVPTVKRPGAVAEAAALRARRGCVQLGTNVRSGTGRALVVATGRATMFGAIVARLASRHPETELEGGLRRFGLLLLVTMLVMVVVVFAANVILGRAPTETLLFAIALAVGLSPELLPAIISVNLARAAQELAGAGVLVRHLDALENLGSMTVLCTDKTGTLTEGVIRVAAAFDPTGAGDPRVMELAAINAHLQRGLANPIDAALIEAHALPPGLERIAELPYDFHRKRLSVIVRRGGATRLITKGAFAPMLAACTRVAGGAPLDAAARRSLEQLHRQWSSGGTRVLAVATREIEPRDHYAIEDERDLELAGFVTLADRPRPGARAAIDALRAHAVRVVMITGDNRFVARHVADEVGLTGGRLVVGADLMTTSDLALTQLVRTADLFAEVDPTQKERILRALRRGGEVAGFFGDGVNDAPAMHASDVAISVESAVDIAKATADLVLTRKDLDVIRRGIEAGRRTFANTLKYVLMTTSANLGNMISMAVASVVLPFLPLTAGQILLNNFLSDVPAIGIATDRVDPELVARPRRWSTRFIARYMLRFGLLSSVFDGLTFGVLLLGFGAAPEVFRTGWFVESLFTELVIALVIRTERRAWRSRPGRTLVWTTVAIGALGLALPYLPLAGAFGFVPIPATMTVAIVGIAGAYVVGCELLKRRALRVDG